MNMLEALELANEVRTQRAVLKCSLSTQQTDLRDVLLDPPACLERAPVEKVISWAHGMHQKRSARLCALAGVNPTREIVRLTQRQRKRLVECYEEHFPKVAG